MLRKYETLILLSPDLTEEDRQNLLNVFQKVVEDYSGELINVDHWGLKELAYPVKKYFRGYYVRLEYGAPGTLVTELERRMRITDGVLKFLTVKLQDEYQSQAEV